MTPILNLEVQHSHVEYVLKDVAGLNPKDAEIFFGHIMLAVGEKRLVLPIHASRHIKPYYVSLNLEQRKFLDVKTQDMVEGSGLAEIVRIAKVILFVTYQFTKESANFTHDQDKKIIKAFKENFCSHILNLEHSVTLKLGDAMLSLRIQSLFNSAGKQIKYGFLDARTKVEIQSPKDSEVS